MIIKNIILPNESYLDKILKILCKNNIPYIYIKEDKEIHYDNYIVRFYHLNENNKNLTLKQIFHISNIFDLYLWDKLSNDVYTSLPIIEMPEYFDFITNKNYKELKKDDYKRSSNLVNIELKNNSKNIKTLKKQLNPSRKIYKNL